MAKNFGEIAYSAPVKEMQEKLGSRAAYARMERDTYSDGLTQVEADFIAQRDSFYMASFGENSYPYIQHRGGPKGFLKVLDPKHLGFIDFKGNMQYITVGNMATNSNIALILVDYPAKTRLKIYAKAEILEFKDNYELYRQLDLDDYKFKAERMMVLNVEAYDWNCPQHITPKYTAEEIEQAFAPQRKHIERIEAELLRLNKELKDAKNMP